MEEEKEEDLVLESDPEVERRIQIFKSDLLRLDVPAIVHKYMMFGNCYKLDNEMYFELKKKVAEEFQIHTSEVLVVGSAKLGFSIAPDKINSKTKEIKEKKRYRQFYDKSDIDVAIVSGKLFDEIWQQVFDYWDDGTNYGYWSEKDFRKYLFRGWVRPDLLPPTRSFKRRDEWWNFFEQIASSGQFGRYSITGAVYKSWHYLEKYQSRCVKECKQLEEDES